MTTVQFTVIHEYVIDSSSVMQNGDFPVIRVIQAMLGQACDWAFIEKITGCNQGKYLELVKKYEEHPSILSGAAMFSTAPLLQCNDLGVHYEAVGDQRHRMPCIASSHLSPKACVLQMAMRLQKL